MLMIKINDNQSINKYLISLSIIISFCYVFKVDAFCAPIDFGAAPSHEVPHSPTAISAEEMKWWVAFTLGIDMETYRYEDEPEKSSQAKRPASQAFPKNKINKKRKINEHIETKKGYRHLRNSRKNLVLQSIKNNKSPEKYAISLIKNILNFDTTKDQYPELPEENWKKLYYATYFLLTQTKTLTGSLRCSPKAHERLLQSLLFEGNNTIFHRLIFELPAKSREFPAFLKWLTLLEIDINAKNDSLDTPLHIIAKKTLCWSDKARNSYYHNIYKMCDFLCKEGANLTIVDSQGRTALSIFAEGAKKNERIFNSSTLNLLKELLKNAGPQLVQSEPQDLFLDS